MAYTEPEIWVRDATSATGPLASNELNRKISDGTRDPHTYPLIFNMLWTRLHDTQVPKHVYRVFFGVVVLMF